MSAARGQRASGESATDAPPVKHPTELDLLNFARERLGGKKQQRILDHCKECNPCQEKLLEAVREYAPEPKRQPLSKWHWISIGLFVLAIAALIVVMIWFFRSLPTPTHG